MRIGHICQSGRSGHTYLSKQFVEAFAKKHEVFLFMSGGTKEQYDDFWTGYSVTKTEAPYNSLMVVADSIIDWIETNQLDAVFVQEFYDWQLVELMKQKTKVFAYIDWFSKESIPSFEIYDKTIISAEHTYDVFAHQANSRFVPWGVDTNLFKPTDGEKMDFFHNAGWGGINNRKCTPETIRAFDKLGRGTMSLHTQTNVFDHETVRRIKKHRGDRMKVKFGSVEHPGLYHTGKVYVGATRLEGLGLYIPEAMACGLPIITTDALPMSQFVKHGETGIVIDPKKVEARGDGYYFPQYTIDWKDIKEAMKQALDNPEDVERMGRNARKFIENNHSLEQFQKRVLDVIDELNE